VCVCVNRKLRGIFEFKNSLKELQNTLQHTASHCNATRCNTLQHTGCSRHLCNTLQHSSTHWNTPQHTTTHQIRTPPLQHTATHCKTLQHAATHCNTLQHAATRCNKPQLTGCLECIRAPPFTSMRAARHQRSSQWFRSEE